jgi:hypothetical protein
LIIIEIIVKKTVDGQQEKYKIETLLIVDFINENVYHNGVRNYD